ncbi:MAG: (Fe-S)-binding protein [Chloroflexi bacterium]|nr:MAG: (Fe-S)-binding protein [Chloroflexota bacterium]
MTKNTNLEAISKYKSLNCSHCGLCLSVCPTYRESLNEMASPRGRVALAHQSLSGELALSPRVFEQMYSCFACMACRDICPAGVLPDVLALHLRQVQEELQPAGWKNTLFHGLVGRMNRLELATLPLRLYQSLGARSLVNTLGMTRLMPKQMRDLEAMLPHLPKRPLRKALPEVTRAYGSERFRAGFFLGCAQNLMFAVESAAAVRVMARNGCTVITPKNTVCCGMPADGYGRQDLAQEQAKQNIAAFERANVDVIVTDCATCGSTLKRYEKLLAADPEWAERASAFQRKVRDISEFLMDLPLEKPVGRLELKVTYHDPCHLRRGQGVWEEPRGLLQMIDGLELIEMSEADWCCGSAGSQLITHYDTSLKVLGRKMENVKAASAQVVASGCPGCQMQLNVGVRRESLAVKVTHPVELLDRAYRVRSS